MQIKARIFLFFILLTAISNLSAVHNLFILKSPTIENLKSIPKKYTCSDLNLSPPLTWSGEPEGTGSFAVVIRDLDAEQGRFIHWIIYNIPKGRHALPEGIVRNPSFTNGTVQGENSFHKIGYDGPCPPPNQKHRYVIELFALDSTVKDKDEIDRHILDKTKMEVLYP